MRLIHTADWQIGKVFRYVDDATMSLLQQARLEAIGTIGGLAQAQARWPCWSQAICTTTRASAIAPCSSRSSGCGRLGAMTWHVIPGNHDADQPNGIWDRVARHGLPGNVRLHREPGPCPLGAGVRRGCSRRRSAAARPWPIRARG